MMKAIKKIFSVLIDILIVYTALFESIPYFRTGIKNEAVRGFLENIDNTAVLVFSIILTVAVTVTDSVLTKKGVISEPDEDYEIFEGCLAKIWWLIKKGVLSLIILFLAAKAMEFTEEQCYSESIIGVIIIFIALLFQRLIKGKKSAISRFLSIISDICFTVGNFIDDVKSALGKHIVFAVYEIIFLAVVSYIAVHGESIIHKELLKTAQDISVQKYTIAEIINFYLSNSEPLSADGIFGKIVNMEISGNLYVFLMYMPYCCAVAGMLCLFFNVGNVGSFTRNRLDDLNEYIDSLPPNYIIENYTDEAGHFQRVVTDFSLHGFMCLIRLLIYPFALIMNALLGLILPLDIILNIILAVMARFTSFAIDEEI